MKPASLYIPVRALPAARFEYNHGTMFEKIPPERFAAFHREFQGDTRDVCERCGGKCEVVRLGTLMPGEAEYLAASLGKDLNAFRNEYLDGIVTPYGIVDVLKLKPGCPFLSPSFSCTIKDVKVVLCDVYPVAFEVHDDSVKFVLDDWCPIVRYVPELAREFESKGIAALRRLGAGVDFYRAVALYDDWCVDYRKLFALRSSNLDYVTLTLEQVKECLADDAPPPELPLIEGRTPLKLHRA
jgi:Fe-S-cluster containining protein